LNYSGESYGSQDIGQGEDGGSRNPLRRLRTFRSLKNPVYRLYFSGIMGQRAAMNMQMIARSYLIYALTGSAAILGLLSLCHALPVLLFSIFGGVIADRIQKKYVLLIGLAGSAALSLGVALSLTSGFLSAENEGSWWVLAVASVIQGSIMGLMIPSRQAIIPEIVGEEDLMNAISLDSTGMNTLRLGAPALAGFLIDSFGYGAVYYVMTAMYVAGTVCIILMPLTGKLIGSAGNALLDIKEGYPGQRIRNRSYVHFTCPSFVA
jgi:MFS family permease